MINNFEQMLEQSLSINHVIPDTEQIYPYNYKMYLL